MNLKLTIVSLVLILTGCLVQSGFKQSTDVRPNVLIIHTDDHRFTGVHTLGQTQVKTPNIDGLADDGIAFTKTYLMGSFLGATCVPSRATLLTGRDLFSLKNNGRQIPVEHKTVGETFSDAGYHSHIVGKWHNDNASLGRSFESGARIMGRGIYLTDQYRMPLWDWDLNAEFKKEDAYLLEFDDNRNVLRRSLTKDDKRGPTGTEDLAPHCSELFVESAVSFIEDYKQQKPYLLYLAFPTPHDPRQAPQSYHNLYPVDDIELPPSYMPQHPFDNGHMVLRDEELAAWPRTTEIAKKELSDYYAIITHLDAQIGLVINALKEAGEYENTLIVFLGDSGLAVGNHGLLGKQNVYDEDGLHVPFILSGGLIKQKGKRINALSYIHDVFPTVCELVNVEVPATVKGKSLVPVINDEQSQIRETSYHAYKQFQRAFRKGDFKLIEYVRADDITRQGETFVAGSMVTQLFNIVDDPWETTDLSFFPEYKSIVETMRIGMKQEAEVLGDNMENLEAEKYSFWDYYDKGGR